MISRRKPAASRSISTNCGDDSNRGRAVVVTATSAPDTAAFDATSEIVIERIAARRCSCPTAAGGHRSGDRAPPTRPGALRSGVAPRTARPASFGSLRCGRARRGGDGPVAHSLRRVIASLRAAATPRWRSAPARTPNPRCDASPRSTRRRSSRCRRASIRERSRRSTPAPRRRARSLGLDEHASWSVPIRASYREKAWTH